MKILPGAEGHAAVDSGAFAGGGAPMHTVRIFSKSGEDYSLTARNRTVILGSSRPPILAQI